MIVKVQGPSEIQKGIYYEYDNASIPIGMGGMGIVYEGRCFRVNNPDEYIPVAIKKIINANQEQIDRARLEASIQLKHPNLLRIYGFIPNEEYDPYQNIMVTQYYVAMERLVGVDLSSLIKGILVDRTGVDVPYARDLFNLYVKNRVEFVQTVMTGVLSAISTLHDKGYVHRDIDPSNVMITRNHEIKLIDFGIIKTVTSLSQNGHNLTQAGTIIGKINYAAPEVINGKVEQHNFTTDIYSLGVMLYQLYTGSLPFTGSEAWVMQAQLKQSLPLNNIDNTVIRKIVQKATEKEQSLRFQSAQEMSDAISNMSDVQVADVKLWMWIVAALAGAAVGAVSACFLF